MIGSVQLRVSADPGTGYGLWVLGNFKGRTLRSARGSRKRGVSRRRGPGGRGQPGAFRHASRARPRRGPRGWRPRGGRAPLCTFRARGAPEQFWVDVDADVLGDAVMRAVNDRRPGGLVLGET